MLTQTRLLADLNWAFSSPALIAPEITKLATANHERPVPDMHLPGVHLPEVANPEVASPEVIWPDDHWFAAFPTLQNIERDLPQPRHPHHFRLGQHFEALLLNGFAQHHDLTLKAANLQVFDHKRTVGEFDFLVDYLGTLEHWEVAIKFYLGLGDTRDARHWYGPNTTDRFDIKFNHMLNKQLVFSQNEHAHRTLIAKGLEVERIRGIVKGRLFYPWLQFQAAQQGAEFDAPEQINPTHLKGWWIEQDKMQAADFQNTVYLVKAHWLSPINTCPEQASEQAPKNVPQQHNPSLPVMNFKELSTFLNGDAIEQATHIALVDQMGKEISRGFVVKPEWLARAAAGS